MHRFFTEFCTGVWSVFCADFSQNFAPAFGRFFAPDFERCFAPAFGSKFYVKSRYGALIFIAFLIALFIRILIEIFYAFSARFFTHFEQHFYCIFGCNFWGVLGACFARFCEVQLARHRTQQNMKPIRIAPRFMHSNLGALGCARFYVENYVDFFSVDIFSMKFGAQFWRVEARKEGAACAQAPVARAPKILCGKKCGKILGLQFPIRTVI